MPVYSKELGRHLLTKEECAQIFKTSVATIRRTLKRPGVYTEYQAVYYSETAGTRRTLLIDPETLDAHLNSLITPPTYISIAEAQKLGSDAHVILDRSERISQIVELNKSSAARREAIKELAKAEGVSLRTVYRWLEEEGGLEPKALLSRSDKGGRHLPADTYQLILQAFISNPGSTPSAQIYRSLVRAVPDAMFREYGGRRRAISQRTVDSIREALLDDPRTRLLLADADAKKVHQRSYAGQVFSAYANQLWQMDMTRCDVMVCDPETGRLFRPRVHAIIDVYSGCIPGWAFAIEEDQTQTDLTLLRAFVPKPAPYSNAWPVFGTPERLYWDNGKTYSSEHARRFLSELGVEVIYSRPRVSHTRGKIERFFGTLHSFERTLPGYVGQNAKDRATEELRRITKNTKRWLERGLTQDPSWGNRLLTLAEYQERVLAWLFVEYHDTIVNGKSRLMHFAETAPRKSQRLYNREELMTILARRTTRTVTANGSIRLNNRYWTVESGQLINHVNREVMVLSNQFAEVEEHVIAWRDRAGRLETIGKAVPMPERADSPEAQLLRSASRAAAKRAQLEAAKERRDLLNPHLIVSNALMAQVQAEYEEIDPLPQPQLPTARLKALEGEAEPTDELSRFLLDDPLYTSGMSADDYLSKLDQQWEDARKERQRRKDMF